MKRQIPTPVTATADGGSTNTCRESSPSTDADHVDAVVEQPTQHSSMLNIART